VIIIHRLQISYHLCHPDNIINTAVINMYAIKRRRFSVVIPSDYAESLVYRFLTTVEETRNGRAGWGNIQI
jgi:hypothetical protein